MTTSETKPYLLSHAASDDDILAAVRAWSDVLAAEDYERALTLVRAPGWTADILRKVIAGYGILVEDESPHKVTPIASSRHAPEAVTLPRHNVDRYPQPDGTDLIEVWFDLPIDGFWSDLTATFCLEDQDGSRVLVLETIHVM